MSLDVYLELEGATMPAGSGIWIRENGATRELTRAEWDERFPGCEPVVTVRGEESETVFHANITHNLNRMASQAGVYECLWRPDEVGIAQASQLVGPLNAGLALLRAHPDAFKKFNPPNGWGDYEGLCGFVADYLAACERWPEATVRVSR